MLPSARAAILALAVLPALSACGAAPPGEATAGTALSPFPSAGRGGSVALDPDNLVAYAADADNQALHAIDLITADVTTVPLGATPEQVILIGDDRLAVTLRDAGKVLLLVRDAAGVPRPSASADVPVEPWGLALSPRGELLVTSAWGRALTALHPETLEQRWSVALEREPRGVAVAPDGRRAFVTHLVGDAISVVDLEEDAPPSAPRRLRVLGGHYRNRVDSAIGAGTLHPTAALAYALVLSEGGALLFVPHLVEQNGSETVRSIPVAYGGVPVEEETSLASVAVIATASERPIGGAAAGAHPIAGIASIMANDAVGFAVAPGAAPSRQARAAALAGDALLVASQGTNELVELDARAIDPAMSVRRVFAVGEGPTGVDAAAGVAVVWNQLSHDLSVVELGSGEVQTIEVASDPLPADVAAGRRLFLSERDRRISRDGRACAACHPDGRDDGLVWRLGAGPRQTPMLVGRLERGPFGWHGKHDRLEDNMRETIGRLGGTGLPEADLRRLAIFLREGLRAPRPAGEAAPPRDPEAGGDPRRGRENPEAGGDPRRGREIFASAEVGCGDCHRLETEGSDRAVHVVGSRGRRDATDGFRTPPLLFIEGTAPYFHDGRYATLEELLEDNFDRMGRTSHLSPEELRDLVAFLRTL